ncbi:uncharacterized protein LOC106662724 [Cimex lectularius]|uniref:Uncharacterized protein n=1 Tax=Cimex lectularius TaxID=79782 RepID=A0A8I6TDY1_CIMLE|nr:uncharacterized protein LOC106662724 [Cimex lectularius]
MSLLSKSLKERKNENHVDITELPKCRLLDLLDRQNKIASNKSTLLKLPDKGVKLLSFKKEIEDELKKRNDIADISDVMAGLSIRADIQEIEWTGKLSSQSESKLQPEDENDPLKILATHSGTTFHQKIICSKSDDDPEPDISEQDIQDAYAINLCNKVHKIEPPIKFLPHKTLNKVKEMSKDKLRDLSAAAGPPSKFGSSKEVSLEDSLKIQLEQAKHLKEIQLKHAAERLKDRTYLIGTKMPDEDGLKVYREVQIVDSEEENEDEEEGL